jgi:flagellar motor switch protein FliM
VVVPPSPVSAFPGAAAPERTRAVTPYDFRRPTKLSRDHVRALQVAYETFARRLTTLLTSTLRQVCRVSVAEITQQSYDEYIGRLATPTLLVPMTVAPLGPGALEISLPVALASIDHMLGGPGGNQPTRGLTDIETGLVRRLIDQILGVLAYALEPVVPVEFEVGQIEYNPQFLQIASAADAVVVCEFELVIGRESCPMTICLPLAPLLPRLTTTRPREAAPAEVSAAISALVRNQLLDMGADVRVRFDPVAIDSGTVLSLAVGDVVRLGHRVGAPLTIQVGTSPVARAIAGKSGVRLAALVVDSPEDLAKESR